MRTAILLLAFTALASATTTIQNITANATTAVITVSTDQAGNCTFRVMEGTSLSSYVPINDVNTTLFPGSNSDARFGSVITGNTHVFIAGERFSPAVPMRASDTYYYSRALALSTQHIAGATCGSDAEVTATFWTINPPFGSPYPDSFFPFDPTPSGNTIGNEATPTVFTTSLYTGSPHDGAGKDQVIIDPATGMKLKAVMGPGDYGDQGGNKQFNALTLGIATNWTNPGNIVAYPAAGVTSCSGTCVSSQSPLEVTFSLIAAGGPNFGFTPPRKTDDVRMRLTGCDDAASSADRVWQVALSAHPKLLEVDTNWVDFPALPQCVAGGTGTVATVTAPSNSPAPDFSAWVANTSISLPSPEVSFYSGTMTCASGACSDPVCVSTTYAAGHNCFNINWKTGDALTVAGSNPTCPSNICTIASVTNARALTLQQSLTISSAAWSGTFGAFLVRKKTTTGVGRFTNLDWDSYVGIMAAGPTSGAFWPILSPVATTTTYNRAGTNDGISRTGYCWSPQPGADYGGNGALYFFIPANAESRILQYNLSMGPFSPVQACTWLSVDTSNNIKNNVYTDTTYKETGYNATINATRNYCNGFGSCSNNVTQSTLISGTSLISQITTAYAAFGRTYDAAAFPKFGIDGVEGDGGDTLVLTSYFSGATSDTFALRCYFSISSLTIKSCWDSFSKAPNGWGAFHASRPKGTLNFDVATQNPLGTPFGWVYGGAPAVIANIACVLSRDPSCTVPVVGICNNNIGNDANGSCAGSFDTCPANSYGAAGANCVHVRFANQPAITGASSGTGSCSPQNANCALGANGLARFPWCSSVPGRSGVWSYVKPLEAGDGLRHWTPGNATWDIYLVLSISYPTADHCDGNVDAWLWHDWDGYAANALAFGTSSCYPPFASPQTPPYTAANGCAVLPSDAKLYGGTASHNGAWVRTDGSSCNQSPALNHPACQDNSDLLSIHWDLTSQIGTDNNFMVSDVIRSGSVPGMLAVGQPYYNFRLSNPSVGFSSAASGAFGTHPGFGPSDIISNPYYTDGRNLSNANAGTGFYGIATGQLVAGFSKVYKSSGASWLSGTLDRKHLPVYGRVGRYVLQDVSGPSTVFSDSSVNQFCIAERAGWCVAGSTAGTVFVNAQFMEPSSTVCGYSFDDGNTCIFTPSVWGLNVIQQTTEYDPIGAKYRRLSTGLGGVNHEDGFWSSNVTPNGDYVKFMSMWVNGRNSIMWFGKMPDSCKGTDPCGSNWPAVTTKANDGYVPVVASKGAGAAGDTARVQFGYMENEPVGSSTFHFWCDSQQSACYTSSSASTANPYLHAWETQAYTACSAGCKLSIPSRQGHVLYYQLLITNGGVETPYGSVNVVAIP